MEMGEGRRGPFAFAGNELHIAIPRAVWAPAGQRPASLDFKWADNVPERATSWISSTSGDMAPNGRFAYRYEE